MDKIIELSKVLTDDYKIVMVGYLKDKSILNDNIVYIEHTNNVKELAFYYANADIFFNPTFEDTFPTVNIESLACGTPIILYRGCSGGEDLITEKSGIVVEKNTDSNTIFNMIKNYKGNNEKKLHEFVLKACNKETFCASYELLLNSRDND